MSGISAELVERVENHKKVLEVLNLCTQALANDQVEVSYNEIIITELGGGVRRIKQFEAIYKQVLGFPLQSGDGEEEILVKRELVPELGKIERDAKLAQARILIDTLTMHMTDDPASDLKALQSILNEIK